MRRVVSKAGRVGGRVWEEKWKTVRALRGWEWEEWRWVRMDSMRGEERRGGTEVEAEEGVEGRVGEGVVGDEFGDLGGGDGWWRWRWGGGLDGGEVGMVWDPFWQPSSAHLRKDYYSNICPDVESLVRAAVQQKIQQSTITAPGTLRLFFHDCFVRGCDASVMLVSPKNKSSSDERHNSDDLSLAGDAFDTIVKAKVAVDADRRCTNKVSYADIMALAARDVVSLTGGPSYAVELGRLDGRISTRAGVRHRLPHPDFDLNRLNAMGAPLGFAHCNRFTRRIREFSKTRRVDPTLNPSYAAQLLQTCHPNVDPRVSVTLDPETPHAFDNAYYRNLQKGMGLLTSDQVLFNDPRARPTVNHFASNTTAFKEAFVSAMTKLGRVGVKTGGEGEVRRDCNKIN
ncbi:Peroxidase 45 [Acorus calamus]|uniref:Peroxidase n=1 Tax=Acorus calamus TaxID=4465 RepID=A0AAV9FEC4_ACOCL|nr:Peroxidase 45 [Acorus calamus]